MTEFDLTRAKILGVLIRDARLAAGRSVEDCAAQLGVSAQIFEKIEVGEAEASLPILEVLALYLDVPVAHFMGDQTRGIYPPENYVNFLIARTREIAAHLRAIRQQQELTQEQLAELTGIGFDTIGEYESGEISIPLIHLDTIAKSLGRELTEFLDMREGSYVAAHETHHKRIKGFSDLPEELQAFVAEPINQSYIEIAQKLSQQDVEKLRSIAEGILNITY